MARAPGQTDVAPTPTRTTRRRVESRRRLVEAAREVFAERGIRDTPVELICERAGFTRGAFYSNFALKEDLFLEVFRQETEVRQRRFADALATVGDDVAPTDAQSAREALADIVRAYVTTQAGDENWFILMTEIKLQGMRQPELRERIVETFCTIENALATEIEQFAARLGLRIAVPARDAVRAMLALHDSALTENILHGRPLTADNAFLTQAIPRLLTGLVDTDR